MKRAMDIPWPPLLTSLVGIRLYPIYSLPAPKGTHSAVITVSDVDAMITVGQLGVGEILFPLDFEDNVGLVMPQGTMIRITASEGDIICVRNARQFSEKTGVMGVAFFGVKETSQS